MKDRMATPRCHFKPVDVPLLQQCPHPRSRDTSARANRGAARAVVAQDVGAATAIYKLTRQLGGSIGVTLLALISGFAQKGADFALAKQRALMVLDRSINAQASVVHLVLAFARLNPVM